MSNPHPEPHPENIEAHRFKKGDPSTAERARKGAKASQAKQAKNRTMREWAEVLGELPLHKGKIKSPKSADGLRDQEETNLTLDGQVMAAMYAKATKGDVRAAEFIAKMKGQTTEDVMVHIDAMTQMGTDELLALYAKTKAKE